MPILSDVDDVNRVEALEAVIKLVEVLSLSLELCLKDSQKKLSK